MRTAHNLATLTSRLLTAAKLLPPEDFWRLAAIVTGTLKEEEDASHRTAQDGMAKNQSLSAETKTALKGGSDAFIKVAIEAAQ